jgi:hypothetical protein
LEAQVAPLSSTTKAAMATTKTKGEWAEPARPKTVKATERATTEGSCLPLMRR